VVNREYLVRQAKAFLKLSQGTKDHDEAASLIKRAADLKSRTDEVTSTPHLDKGPQAPDVQGPE
jgi:hypothetical protein